MENNFLCLLLAGGLSKRFGGQVKTFAKINNETIFEKIIKTLKKQNTKIIINTNSNIEIFSKSGFELIKDLNSHYQGPLAGLYSAMHWVKKNKLNIEWILSVPSDTPFLPNNLLEVFKSKIIKNRNILIACSNGKFHPVVGLWNINLYENLEEELKSDNRKIMKWVYKNEYEFVDFPMKKYDPFFNINRKEDIEEAEKIEKIINQLEE